MNLETIKKLAELSRLSIAQKEQEKVLSDLGEVLSFVDKIQEIKVDNVSNDPHSSLNVFREDLVDPLASSHDLVKASPDAQEGFVKVPKVL